MNRDLESKPVRMRAHSVQMDNRERVSVTGVSDVDSFNEQEVVLSTEQGGLVITGEQLHIMRLNLDEGQLVIGGLVSSVEYEGQTQVKGGLFSRVFR